MIGSSLRPQDGRCFQPRDQLDQQFHPLRENIDRHRGQAGRVAAWARERRSKPALDGIVAAESHDDGDRASGGAGGANRHGGRRDDDVDADAHQLSDHRRKTLDMVLGEPRFQDRIATIDVAPTL